MSLFEGIRNFANKKITNVATGAVLLSANACEKPKEQKIPEDDKNKTEVTNDSEYYRQKYFEYMKHPSYKERLAKEMYGNQIIDEEKQKNVDKEYRVRKKQLKKVPIEMLSPENELSSKYEVENGRRGKIISGNKSIYHEISHSLDHNQKAYENVSERQKGFRDILYKILKVENSWSDDDIEAGGWYWTRNTEIKARLNSLRIRAVNEFDFDLNDEFDINKFEKLKEDRQYKELRDVLELSDDQINELMKYTAENNPKNFFYPPGSEKEKFNKGYHIPGVDYGEEERQA